MINFNKLQPQKIFSHRPELGRLALQPVMSENDELIRSIENDYSEPWSLDRYSDTDGLVQSWSDIAHDLENDIDFIDFVAEDE